MVEIFFVFGVFLACKNYLLIFFKIQINQLLFEEVDTYGFYFQQDGATSQTKQQKLTYFGVSFQVDEFQVIVI